MGVSYADFLPATMFEQLRLNKRESDGQACTAIASVTDKLGACDPSRKILALFLAGLRKAGIWPPKPQSVSQLKFQVAGMDDIHMSICLKSGVCPCYKVHPVKSKLIAELDKVYKSITGICLDCIKRETLGDTRKCRVKHDTDGRRIA